MYISVVSRIVKPMPLFKKLLASAMLNPVEQVACQVYPCARPFFMTQISAVPETSSNHILVLRYCSTLLATNDHTGDKRDISFTLGRQRDTHRASEHNIPRLLQDTAHTHFPQLCCGQLCEQGLGEELSGRLCSQLCCQLGLKVILAAPNSRWLNEPLKIIHSYVALHG